jgi:uncharacterized protein (DUF885 family)
MMTKWKQGEPHIVRAVRCCFIGAVLFLLLGGQATAALAISSDAEATLKGLQALPFEEFLERSFRELLLRAPEAISAWGLADVLGVRNDRLTSLDPVCIEESYALERGILGLLNEYDRAALSSAQRVWHDCYAWALETGSISLDEFLGDSLLNGEPRHSFPADLESVFFRHPLHTRADAEDYLTRLGLVPVKTDQIIALAELQLARGYVNSPILLESCVELIDRILGIEDRVVRLSSTVLVNGIPAYQDFLFRLADVEGLVGEDRGGLITAVRAGFEEEFIPALWKLRDYVKQLVETTGPEPRVAPSAPDRAGYEAELRAIVSTDLTPEAIHVLARRRVDELMDEIRDVMIAKGFSEQGASVSDFMQLVWRNLSVRSAYVAGEELLARFEEIASETRDVIAMTFDCGLIAEPEIRQCSEGSCAFGSYYYVLPSLDGTRPGTFWFGGSAIPACMLRRLYHHELIPGHHLQHAVANALDVPLFMKILRAPGFSEGWATYCENLMWQYNAPEAGSPEHLIQLSAELLVATGAAIETGLHALHWTRQHAADYYAATYGSELPPEHPLLDYYEAFPVDETVYFVGRITLIGLRERAEQALGTAFSLPAFHQAVIGSGNVPLVVLDRLVSDYIAKNLPSPIQTEADGAAIEFVTLWR